MPTVSQRTAAFTSEVSFGDLPADAPAARQTAIREGIANLPARDFMGLLVFGS